jgi:DNA-binding transcriptional regulator GbsR (MarR family)
MAVTRLKPLYDKLGTLKGYVDKYTGEEYGFPVIIGRKKNPYSKGWVMNSQEALEIVAKDKDIKGETYRVLFFICARLDFENWVQISVTEIANELDLKQPSVSRAMKVLETKEIILRGPKVGRCYAFMLNPEFGWKGKVKNLDEYRKERDRLEQRERKQEKTRKNSKLLELSKEDQIIKAIKEGKINVEKFYNLLHEEQENSSNPSAPVGDE